MSNLRRGVWAKLLLLKGITGRGLGAKLPAAVKPLVDFFKKSYFNAIKSHFARVQNHLKDQIFF